MPLPPTHMTAPFGVRITLFFLIRALNEYAKHEVNNDATLPAGAITPMKTLLSLLPQLIALNPEGPN